MCVFVCVPWALFALCLVNGVSKLLAAVLVRVQINGGVHIGQHFCWDKTSPISSLFIIYSKWIFCRSRFSGCFMFCSVQGKRKAILGGHVKRRSSMFLKGFSALPCAAQSPCFKGVCLVMILFQAPGGRVLVQEKINSTCSAHGQSGTFNDVCLLNRVRFHSYLPL